MMATMIAIRTDGNADGELPPKPGGDAQRAPEALVGDDQLAEGACRPPREDTRDHEVARQAQPAGDQCRHDHEAERPQGAEPVQGAEQRCQPVRQRVEEVEDRALAAGDVAVVERAHDQDRDPEEQAEPVARAPPQRALRRGAEHADPPRARRLYVGRLARGHHGYMVPTPGLGVA